MVRDSENNANVSKNKVEGEKTASDPSEGTKQTEGIKQAEATKQTEGTGE
jgi:hypothetical protein